MRTDVRSKKSGARGLTSPADPCDSFRMTNTTHTNPMMAGYAADGIVDAYRDAHDTAMAEAIETAARDHIGVTA